VEEIQEAEEVIRMRVKVIQVAGDGTNRDLAMLVETSVNAVLSDGQNPSSIEIHPDYSGNVWGKALVVFTYEGKSKEKKAKKEKRPEKKGK